jgi:hypothetical protein
VTLFAGLTFFMLARSLVPRFSEMLIAASTSAAVRYKNPLARRSQIRDGLIRLCIEYHRAYRNQERHVFARLPAAIGTLSVTATVGFEFTVIAITQQRVVINVGFQINTCAMAAIAAGRAATRNVFFAAKRHAAVAAMASLYEYFCFISEHEMSFELLTGELLQKQNGPG